MGHIWYINGEFVSQENAHIPANDAGLIRGYAVFEYARAYGKVPFMLHEHLERLFESAKFFGLEIPLSQEEIVKVVHQLLAKNSFSEAGIKVLVSGGPVLDLMPEEKSALYIFAYPYTPFPKENYSKGITVKTVEVTRPFSACKTAFYLPGIVARREATAAGFEEGAFVDAEGYILECPTSNLFFLRDGKWVTPKEGILKGLTRDVVMSTSDLPVEERPVHISELGTFEEVFTTSTNREIMPICRINEHVYPLGKATQRVASQYALYVQQAVLPQKASL